MNETAMRLRQLRESSGLNQKDFATSIGIKYTTYNGYETGKHKPNSDVLVMIADKYGVTVDYLLGKNVKPTPVPESGGISPARQALLDSVKDLDDESAKAVLEIIRSVKKLRDE